ncbi:nuclear hormone receptor family member nhr-111-like isoform X2 [Centruroides sculpturatus]|uniref:nuclear hormone receptor family member nhr-111-like isoform X2 n=1 Tax=Centruroides sculpturatus TaxID=218467 RepID=UPI000C6E3AF5|nr:nuclear hormone receptor family member nhr-111-like isoform X2 [Centruroides sculpturatus]
MMSDSHLNNTCSMNGSLESEDNEDGNVFVTLPTRQCVICGKVAKTNIYGAYTCVSCAVFFGRHVRLEKEIITCVTVRGNCSTIRRRNIITCDFCRFSKCHDANLRHEIITSSPRFVLPSPQIEDERIFLNYSRTFTKCLKYMEQYYYKWLNSFPSFRLLSEERKKDIRLKTHERGAVMQLVERSLNVFQMLRLHNCFIYIGWQSLEDFIIIIKDIQELRDHVNDIITHSFPRHLTTVEAYNILKLDLILQDDVLITDKHLEVTDLHDFLQNIIENLMDFMTDMLEEFETEENFEQIESLR